LIQPASGASKAISDSQNNDLSDQFGDQSAMTDSLAFVAWPRSTPIIAGCLMATVALVGVWILERNSASQYLDEVRADTVRDLAAVRGAAEIAINRRVHLTLGLKAYVSINPDINEHEFADFAALLMKEADGIRSVTSIKDNVINDVYPREGNEGAIGLELLKNPDQRVAAEYAIETGRPWLAGPYKLVQGGEAFINRAPVYVTEAVGRPGDGRYWGMVSILVDKQTLSDEILKEVPEDLTIAIRGRANRSEPGEVFLGDPNIESSSPITAEVSLPTGRWQLYGVPKAGWPSASPHSISIWGIGALLSLFASTLVFSVVRLLVGYREYSHRLEIANERASVAQETVETSRQKLAEKAAQLETTVSQLEDAQSATLNMLDDIEQARRKLQASGEALEQSNLELQQFAYVASHDLQTPLRAVAGFAQLLQSQYQGQLDDDADKYIATIVSSCERMKTMINDLLTYSRVESQTLPFKPVEMLEIFDGAAAILSGAVKETSGTLTHGDLPTVNGDKAQLSQLMMNLIGNGLKYHGEEPPQIHVEAEESPDEWTISIRDNGIGIEPRFYDRIFDIFRRLHTQEEYKGTGIGLAICRRIVKKHNGRLWLESKLGEGTTFYFTIPKSNVETSPAIGVSNNDVRP
jgi:signal transduction histidine kinase